MAVNPDKNGVEQSLIARLIGKIKRIALDMGDSVTVETSRAQAAEAAAKTEVVQGENCTVEKTTAADGHDVYTINADGKPQVQADWNQADSTKVDYIKNKPNLALKEDVANKKQSIDPTSTTEYGSSKAVADFVNSSVATNTANFLGNFTLTDLSLTYPATDVQIAAALNSHTWPSGVTPTNNDYVYVEIQNPQTTGVDDKVERFKFSDMLEPWGYEYTLNNSSFTAAEMATLESGITASDKTAWNSHVSSTSNPHSVTKAQVGLGNVDNTSDANKPVSTAQQTALNAKMNIDGSNGTKEGVSALINKLDGGTATPHDGDFFVSQYAGGGSSNLSFYRRPMSSLWNYIRGKILGWYDWTRVDSGIGRYAKICSIADPASGTSYTVDVLVTHMTSYYAVTGLVRITVSHGSSSVQASILASDSSFYAVDSGNPPKVYTYVDGNGNRTFVFDTASAYQTAQGFVFRAVGGFSDKWSFFGDVGCSNDADDLGSIGTKQNALDVPFVFATYAKTAGHAATASSADNATSATNAGYAYQAGNAETVNSHTVDKDVPSNAVFTDTTYSQISRGSGAGLAPGLPSGSGTSKYLREDGTWYTPPNDTYSAGYGLTLTEMNQFSVDNPFNPNGDYSGNALKANYAASAGNASTVNNHSVNKDVPSNAVFTDTTYSDATTSASGLMSASDKSKLNGIANNANNYTHPTSSGNKHIPSGGSSDKILRWSADGTATWDDETKYVAGPGISIFNGAISASVRSVTQGGSGSDAKIYINGGSVDGSSFTVEYANGAGSAQYAVGASNYTTSGSIASALNLKAPLSHEHSASDITSGTFGASRLDIGMIRKSGNYLVPRMPILWASGDVNLVTSTDSVLTAVRDNGYGTPITVINGTTSSITVTGVYPSKGTTTIPARKSRIFTYYNANNGFFDAS